MDRPQHPQRLTPPAAPGALLKRMFALAPRVREILNERDEGYLKLIRQCPCLKCGMEPPPNVEAAHIRRQSAAHGKRGGISKKPADCWTVPLCASCHRTDRDALHMIGEDLFFHILGIEPLLVCERLWSKRGDFVAMRAVALQAIAERSVIKAVERQT